MAASIKIPTTFTAIDKFSKVVKNMSKGIKQFANSGAAGLKRLDSKINSTFNKLGRFSQLALGVGFGAIFGAAIKNNIEFNDSLASVSAITGATGKDLAELERLSMSTAKETTMLGKDVLKAYELIGSAKPELLENGAALDSVTRSVITLSKASRMDLETSAKSLTDVMNQFNVAGEESGMVIDVLAAGAKYGAAAIPAISDAIVQFGTVAKQSNVSLMESVAAIEIFASKGIQGAEAGTKMRNVLTTLATAKALPKEAQEQLKRFGVDMNVLSDKGVSLSDRLKELSKIGGDATAMVKVFGKENQGAAGILLGNVDALDKMTLNLKEQGVANTQAAANTNTLAFAVESVKTSFFNLTTATNTNNKSMEFVIKLFSGVAKNMDTVIVVIGLVIGAFVALKIAVGIIKAIEVATKLWAGAQTVLNFIMTANPIGLIIMGVAALIALVVLIIVKYNEWGAALSFLLGPLGFIISIIQSFRRNWDMVKESFASGGILGGLKAIGKVLIDAVLMPVQQLLEILANIPGLGGLAGKGAETIAKLRSDLGVETGDGAKKEVLPSTSQAANKNIIESKNKNTLDVTFKGDTSQIDKAESGKNNDAKTTIKTTSTVGNN